MVKSTRTSSTVLLKIENNKTYSRKALQTAKATTTVPHQTYKKGLKGRRNTPVNAVIWAMESLNGRIRGVAIEKLRTFIEKNFEIPCERSDVLKKINTTIMFAVSSGILEKRHGLYYLRTPKHTRFPFRS